jgi:DNA-binding response OmpR family regulator
MRILLIDDDAELAAEMAEALAGEGHQVDMAGDPDEGRRRMAGCRYDLVLLDYKLPGYDGIELLKRMLGHQDIPPVILISGSLNLTDLVNQAGLQHVVKAVVAKPFNISDLIAMIHSL